MMDERWQAQELIRLMKRTKSGLILKVAIIAELKVALVLIIVLLVSCESEARPAPIQCYVAVICLN
jgi:hypothetical protein